ncbi:RES family NAD+ phosphorylase [Bradyrhizobium diazoefficiens]|uniref:RES family NAD+ phosphorylase n=1 Tax=Bradyrhizobium diazoefficiens TaxID=1355477 RepID=UPI0027147D3C|nr:RES family NAD+ phosphorylase [Bradyrhizobium diazoefficiens]WLC16653.1 RES family NAD+ phosphorylase [Bradyrhizobium diazoefficiens]
MLSPTNMPPADLNERRLPVEEIPAGEAFFRMHRTALGAKFFGRTGWRFDSPGRAFGTLYAARTAEIAFAETLLRGQRPIVAESELHIRSFCEFRLQRVVRLVKLHGPSLIAIGATAAVTSGSYDVSQAWAQALHDHPDQPDGILYRSARDNDRFALALFERAAAALDLGTSTPVMADPARLGGILDHYSASLV